MTMERIVILGGGTGGTMMANMLAKKLSPKEAEITLVSNSPRAVRPKPIKAMVCPLVTQGR